MSKCRYCHKGSKFLFVNKEFNGNSLITAEVKIPFDSRYIELSVSGESIFIGHAECKKKISFCPFCGRNLREMRKRKV